MAAACSDRLRWPIARSAQLTPFFTKFRSSVAAPLDEREAGAEPALRRRLVVQGQRRQQREAGPLLELGAPARPSAHHRPGVRRSIEQIEAQRVADRPVVEVAAPRVHLGGRRLRGIGDEGDQRPRLVPAGVPEGVGQGMVAAQAPGQRLHRRHRDAERLGRGDAVAGQAVAVLARPAALEPGKRRGDFGGGSTAWRTRRWQDEDGRRGSSAGGRDAITSRWQRRSRDDRRRRRTAGKLGASAMGALADLRLTLRYLRTHLAYTVAAVATLALGVGATTAMFSAVYAVLLAPQPIRAADRLVVGWGLAPERSHGLVELTYRDVEALGASSQTVAAMAGVGARRGRPCSRDTASRRVSPMPGSAARSSRRWECRRPSAAPFNRRTTCQAVRTCWCSATRRGSIASAATRPSSGARCASTTRRRPSSA